MNSEIHHNAYRISKGSLNMIQQLFEVLALEMVYKPKEGDWALFKQKDNDTRIQVIEVDKEPINTKGKEESHIGFISDNPLKDLIEIKNFALRNNIKFTQGSWSEQEHWFDLPELFIDFVIEIMDKKILDQE